LPGIAENLPQSNGEVVVPKPLTNLLIYANINIVLLPYYFTCENGSHSQKILKTLGVFWL